LLFVSRDFVSLYQTSASSAGKRFGRLRLRRDAVLALLALLAVISIPFLWFDTIKELARQAN
jgi:hypothetical protein